MLNVDFQNKVEVGSVIILNKYKSEVYSVFQGYALCDNHKEHICGECLGKIISKRSGSERIEVGCYRHGSDNYNVRLDIQVRSDLFSNEEFEL